MGLVMGLVMDDSGPLIHGFHTVLDGWLFAGQDQSKVAVIIGKLVVDQLLFAPLLTALYLYSRALTEDRGIRSVTNKLRTELPKLVASGWAVWIPANFVNYGLVPLHLRVLFGSSVAFFWNAYLNARVSNGGSRETAQND